MGLIDLIVGFIVGIISSYIFWLTLALTKPKILISPSAVYYPKDGSLKIKIINNSRRQAVDIQVETAVDEITSGKRRTIHRPTIKNDTTRFALEPRHKDKDIQWGLPASTIFVIIDGKQILDLLESSNKLERRLLFTLSATDAISGSKSVQRVSYLYSDIQHGDYCGGLNFKVMESPSNDSEEGDI